jgi:hypothetical protein
MNGANRSIGTGRIVVVLCSFEIPFIVCKKRMLQGDRLRGNHRRRLNDQLTSVMGCPVVHVIATDIDVVEVRGHINSRPTAFYLPIEDLGEDLGITQIHTPLSL